MNVSARMAVGSGSVQALITELVGSGDVLAAAAIVGDRRRVLGQAALGRKSDGASHPLPAEALFDLASLTKILSVTLALRLDQRGSLPLDLPIGEIWSESPAVLRRLPLQALLRHCAGFKAWVPLYARCRNREEITDLLLSTELLGAPQGTYSDLGVILWGKAVERTLRLPLQEVIRQEIALPLQLHGLASSPVDGQWAVPCPLDNEREIQLAAEQGIELAREAPPSVGHVQDGNARFLGRSAAHAGLFARATDLWKVGRAWLEPTGFLAPARVERAWSGTGSHVLGWKRGGDPAKGGPDLAGVVFGHTGFTGGSLRIDPARNRVFVLLAHRSSIQVDMEPWRNRFHEIQEAYR
jgi:CubicO group peptidase (beta-lactamase class C family)